MRVEQQEINGCMLSTIAALADAPLSEVQKHAYRGAGVETCWNEVFSYSDRRARYQRGVEAACNALDPTGLLLELVGRRYSMGADAPAWEARYLPKRSRKLPAKGRGTVITKRGPHSHIAAWCDGVIYDSNNPDIRMSLREFRMRYGSVISITWTKEGKHNA